MRGNPFGPGGCTSFFAMRYQSIADAIPIHRTTVLKVARSRVTPSTVTSASIVKIHLAKGSSTSIHGIYIPIESMSGAIVTRLLRVA